MHEIDKVLHKFNFLCKRNFRIYVRKDIQYCVFRFLRFPDINALKEYDFSFRSTFLRLIDRKINLKLETVQRKYIN